MALSINLYEDLKENSPLYPVTEHYNDKSTALIGLFHVC